MTAPRAKALGFKAVQPHGTYLEPKALQAQTQNVDRRIPISIEHQTTMRTLMHSDAQILLNQFTARRAHLGRVPGIDQHHRAPSLFRFVARVLDHLCPGDIRDAFAHSTAAADLLRLKFLKRDHLVAIDQATAALVGKILAAKSDALVDATERLLAMPILVPLLRAFGGVFELLRSFELGLVAPEKARVFDLLTLTCRQERGEPHIHADKLRSWWQTFGRDFNREGHVPLVRARAFQANRLDFALDRPVPNDLDAPDLGDDQIVASDLDPVAVLRVGDRAVAVDRL